MASHMHYKHSAETTPAPSAQPVALADSFTKASVEQASESTVLLEIAPKKKRGKWGSGGGQESTVFMDDTPNKKFRKDGRPKLTRGSTKRKRPSPDEQLEAVAAHEAAVVLSPWRMDESGNAVGTSYPYSTVFKWAKSKAKLSSRVGPCVKKRLSLTQQSWMASNSQVKLLMEKLLHNVTSMRKQKKPVTTKIALFIARALYLKMSDDAKPWPKTRRSGTPWTPTKHWVRAWMHANAWKKRRATKTRNCSMEQDSASMQRYCDKLRWRLRQAPAGVENPKEGSLAFGYFPLRCRFNVDQVGLEFDVSTKTGTWSSHEERAGGNIHIRRGQPGWEKRAATLQLCLSADLNGPQPPPVIIFKGAGHISEVEKLSYNPGVHVMFQKKAWLDREVCSSWVSDVWSPFVKANFDEHEGCLLTCDSVDPQRLRSFEKSLKEARTTHHLGEPKFTHVWQMIDRHVGKTWKDLYFELQIEHLSVDAEWEKFISLKAWERRVLMTHWVVMCSLTEACRPKDYRKV